jgi:hypothetical protein
MGNSAIAFNAAYSGLPEASASASFGRAVVSRCMMVTAQRQRAYGDQGPGQDIVATLRFLASDATAASLTPTAWALGTEIKVTRTGRGETVAAKYKIGASRETGDVVALGLEDVAQT